MSDRRYTLQQVRAASKPVDAWFTVLFADPIAYRIVWLLANFTSIGPNTVSILWVIIRFGAVALYCQGSKASITAAAILFLASFILDCVDGKLARLKGQTSRLGTWMDHFVGIISELACIVAVLANFYSETSNQLGLLLGVIFIIYYVGSMVYTEVVKPRLKKRIHSPVLQDNAEPFTPAKLRRLRLTLSPGPVEANVLLLVVFPLMGMVFEGLVAAVIVIFIDFATYLAERVFLMTSRTARGDS